MSKIVRVFAAAAALVLASGCATTNGDARDPFEGFNRAMYGFNEGFDEVIGRPVAGAYKDVIPDPVRTWVRNFFANIGDLFIGANNLLQAKPGDAVNDWARFAFNTTFGVLGINDVASDMGLEKHDEDFGQTFGRWGMGSGAYLVWPFLGSSSVRDTGGRVLDLYFDPVRRHSNHGQRNSLQLLRATSVRADLLDASRVLEEAALDKYVFQRDFYLQRRRNQVFDGNPPREGAASRREEPAAQAPAGVVNPALPAGVDVSYAPRVPRNYDAVMSAARGERHALSGL